MDKDLNSEGNLEIDQALKEFEEKSKSEPSSYKAVKFYNETDTPKMVRLVMKYSGGVIKEQKQAEYVLFGFVVLAIGISLYLFFGGKTAQQKLTPAQLEQMRNMMPLPSAR